MQLILFDIDGTLVKSNPIQVESYSFAIRRIYGIEGHLNDIVPDGKVDSLIFPEILQGRGIPGSLARQRRSELYSARYQYLVHNMHGPLPEDVLPGVDHLLKMLAKHAMLGVVTGNEERAAWHRLATAGLKDFFLTGGFGNESEERAQLVKIAVEKAARLTGQRFRAGEIVLVGDTPRDVLCAQANNLPIIAVATGRYGVGELQAAGADMVLIDLTHLSEFQHFVEQLAQ